MPPIRVAPACNLLLLALLGNVASSSAQAPVARPPARVVSPELAADRRATFRMRAPSAKQVQVRGQWSTTPLPLQRDDEGLWTATTEPVLAGIWEYSLVVDGLSMIDPSNPAIKPMREPRASILHVPGEPPNAWDFQDVPHGVVHQHTYRSKSLGRVREAWVYTPPGYGNAPGITYPLFVLQHGSGDNHQTWVAHGRAHWILDNLLAAGKVRPMVMLMLDGHPLGTVPRESTPQRRVEALEAFQRELFDDGLPLVEREYRISPGATQRAIAGLSMGGGQALFVGLGNPDKFAWTGAFSAGVPADDVLERLLARTHDASPRPKLLWIACGREDRLIEQNSKLVGQLKERQIEHVWQPTDGGHTWPVWREYLVELAPKLFRD